MKAILLAAGYGKRLRPLTKSTPKCLIKINGVPLLERWLNLLSHQKINEVLINTHYLAHKVEKFIECIRHKDPGLHIELKYEEKLLGTAGTVWFNQDFIGNNDCIIINADNLANVNLLDIYNFHKKNNKLVTLGYLNKKDATGCGVLELGENSIITKFEEKPKIPFSKLVYSGIQVISSEVFNLLPFKERRSNNYINLDFGYDIFPNLIGDMVGYKLDYLLLDIGTLESYYKAKKVWPKSIK